MSGKMIPFEGKEKETAVQDISDSQVTDSGDFGNLKFKIYGKWNTIHIEEGDKVFKKDCHIFEELFERLDTDTMKEGSEYTIPGSGDNADLIITIKDGEPVLRVEEKKIPGLVKLKKMLQNTKDKVLGTKKRPPRRRSDRTNK